MSKLNFIFDRNALSLYDKLSKGRYSSIVNEMPEIQKQEYNYWLSLNETQRDQLRHIINAGKSVVVGKNIYQVENLNFSDLPKLLSAGNIVEYKVLTDEYLQFTDGNGINYIVYARYDPITNQVLSH